MTTRVTWRLYSRVPDGGEDVAETTSLPAAVAQARALLVEGRTIIRLESDEGEILEGKQLQEALVARPDQGVLH